MWVLRQPCPGCLWTGADITMWLGCAVFTLGVFVALTFEFEPPLALFYCCPFWLTLIFGPLGPRPLLMLCYAIVLFSGTVSFLKTYPSQCRDLWKEAMVFDVNWNRDAALKALADDRAYLMPGANAQELREWINHIQRGVHHVHKAAHHAGHHVHNAITGGGVQQGPSPSRGLLGEFGVRTGGASPFPDTDWSYLSGAARRRGASPGGTRTAASGNSDGGGEFFPAADLSSDGLDDEVSPPPLGPGDDADGPGDGGDGSGSGTSVPASTTMRDPVLGPDMPRIPSTRDADPMMLKIYCASKRLNYTSNSSDDFEFPTVFLFFDPPTEKGIFSLLKQTCYPWTCTFTERHSPDNSSNWSFVTVFLFCVILEIAHYGLGGFFVCEVLFGTGQCRLWWLWFWAAFLPIWCSLYVTLVSGFGISDLFALIWDRLLFLVQDLQAILIVMIVVSGLILVYINRAVAYRMLGIEDHYVVHWINMNRSNRATARVFQVCVWRVDIDGQPAIDEFHRWESNPNALETDLQAVSPSRKGSWLVSADRYLTGGYTALWDTERPGPMPVTHNEHQHMRIPGGQAAALFVRLAYGHNEVQNTRVQRLIRPSRTNSVYYFQENFRLIKELSDETLLYIEVRDQKLVGAHDLGRVSFDEYAVDQEFIRSKKMERRLLKGATKSRGGTIGTEQVVRMMEARADRNKWADNETGVEMRKKMWEVGFAPHPLSAGGAIWLAFSDMGYDGAPRSNCLVM